ncbi:hypothetical protein H8711_07720 [Clostridiaceae bacterium NSJ-31]|uniref:Uncharacterized protein n=1 Tax=Ligaoa zhengdingensis TaxID=2763658 RepID=A0A926DZ85_9FIRM|nr:hypothetical protein [Ligaoa zhengdingensis]MBC8546821.1 hypothetical protein [Ligaoa zhengdingensis]
MKNQADSKPAKFFKNFRTLFRTARNLKVLRYLIFFPPHENELYILFLTYQCEFALYQISTTGANEDLLWDEFVQILRRSPELLSTAKAAIQRAVEQFPRDQFDFDISQPVKFFEDHDKDETMQMARLFSEKDGFMLLQRFVLQAEAAHFSHLAGSAKPRYTWKAYLKALHRDSSLRQTLIRAFQDGLKKIDFETALLALAEDLTKTEGEST